MDTPPHPPLSVPFIVPVPSRTIPTGIAKTVHRGSGGAPREAQRRRVYRGSRGDVRLELSLTPKDRPIPKGKPVDRRAFRRVGVSARGGISLPIVSAYPGPSSGFVSSITG